VLLAKPGAFVVMLVPVLHLTTQQAAVFANSGFLDRGWGVGCYNSGWRRWYPWLQLCVPAPSCASQQHTAAWTASAVRLAETSQQQTDVLWLG
jgi:hypothetical protein